MLPQFFVVGYTVLMSISLFVLSESLDLGIFLFLGI